MNTTRYVSLDILRGLAIAIMIMGNLSPDTNYTMPQLLHKDWEGLTLLDMAFPSFVFTMGVSMVFSKGLSGTGWFGKMLRRSIILFLLGLLLNHLPGLLNVLAHTDYSLSQYLADVTASYRPLGVLQRLALVYFISTIIYKIMPHQLLLWPLAFSLMIFSTVAYHLYNGADPYNELANISIYIDQLTLGTAHTYLNQPFDPEGLWGTINATATALIGIIVGLTLKNNPVSIFAKNKIHKKLFTTGLFLLITGYLWSYVEIVSKPLWTAPYVLTVTGIDVMVLAFVEARSDSSFFQALLHPFKAIGQNPLFIYLLTEIGVALMYTIFSHGEPLYTWLYHHYVFVAANAFATTLLYTVLWLVLCLIVAEFMYTKNIIIKL